MSLQQILDNAKNIRQGESVFVEIKKTGDSFEGKYVSATEAKGSYKGQVYDAVEFKFELGGKIKTWTRRLAAKPTIALLDQFQAKGIVEGDVVKITRLGEATSTAWEVQKVANKAPEEKKVDFDF